MPAATFEATLDADRFTDSFRYAIYEKLHDIY